MQTWFLCAIFARRISLRTRISDNILEESMMGRRCRIAGEEDPGWIQQRFHVSARYADDTSEKRKKHKEKKIKANKQKEKGGKD